ncbi:MAG: response regulator transcription factor [Defluviitaleaceae bacterium]|nr:response regulator transcription factor [Defluviitaleaceae bacterium]
MKNILLIEDNEAIQEINKDLLEELGGYTVRLAMDLEEARQSVADMLPDLIVLDIMLPDGSGLDFLAELRNEMNINIPVLLLTALSETSDELRGINAGGDDYMAKPYDNNLLLARIQRLLQRASQMPRTLSIGRVKIDTASKKAYVNGADMMLSTKELSLLEQFIQHPEKMMSAESLYEKVWGQKMMEDTNALKTAIYRLRAKLLEFDSGYTIAFSKGDGYYFEQA